MPVSRFDSVDNSVLNLTWLREPSSETELLGGEEGRRAKEEEGRKDEGSQDDNEGKSRERKDVTHLRDSVSVVEGNVLEGRGRR